MPTSARTTILLLAIFTASGAAGLVYEVVWMRILSLTLSVTVYAVTTVLCAFMAGLASARPRGRVAQRIAARRSSTASSKWRSEPASDAGAAHT
jgi:spermidine synthase